jgi:porphobilinogen synthase
MVRETRLTPDNFILPLFVCEGDGVRREVPSMPGVCQLSVDEAVKEATAAKADGVPGVLLFGLPAAKDHVGSLASDPEAPVQSAVRALKRHVPGLLVITDVCLCEYTSHGHCGIVDGEEILNDVTVHHLVQASLSHAVAGADFVAPSDMMDGRVAAIRQSLDQHGFENVGIISYARSIAPASTAPSARPPIRRRSSATGAAIRWIRKRRGSDPRSRDGYRRRRRHHHDQAGAALPRRDRAREGSLPSADGGVSRQRRYAMLKAAAQTGWIDEPRVMMETLIAIRRAGAEMIITYYARERRGAVMQMQNENAKTESRPGLFCF